MTMCFYHEYDWFADVWEMTCHRIGIPGGRRRFCDECRREITPGEWAVEVYAQEYEECQCCEGFECECVEPDFGETQEYLRCRDCARLYEAVRQSELEAGCPAHTSEPPYCQLWEAAFKDVDQEESIKYLRKHRQLFGEPHSVIVADFVYRAVEVV